MSSAAVLAVYAAGYVRTRSAADRLAQQAQERRVSRTHSVPMRIAEVQPTAAPAPKPQPEVAVQPVKPVDPPVTTAARSTPAPDPQPGPATVQPVVPETPAIPPPAPVAAAPPPPPPVPEKAPEPPKPVYKDGTYRAWGSCRHGDIEATVVIEGSLIKSVAISDCQTRYSCSVIDRLPPLVPKLQKSGTDWVSGATESSDAFDFAVAEALAKAK